MEREEWAELIGPVARELLGEPSSATTTELRYGTRGSLSVDLTKGVWQDFETGEGGGVAALIAREVRIPPSDWLRERGFTRDEPPRERKPNGAAKPQRRIVATFDYNDKDGVLLFQVVRFEPKDFRQRRPDKSQESGWTWSTKGLQQVPYCLDRLQEPLGQGLRIIIAEGEKSCDLLWKYSIPATCNAGGAGKWKDELTEHFSGAIVTIIPDYDPQKKHPKTGELMFHADGRPMLPGQDHAMDVARALNGIGASVHVLDLGKVWPGARPKDDIYDWFTRTTVPIEQRIDEFNLLIEQADEWSEDLILTFPGDSEKLEPVDMGIVPESIDPRQWLLANQFCRQYISSVVAAGGTGKSALRLLQFISLASGKELSGDKIFQRCRVLLISLEDDMMELQRRIEAVIQRFSGEPWNLTRDDIRGWLFCATPSQLIKLAVLDNKSHARVGGLLEKQIRTTIKALDIDLLSLDPFVKTHALEENDSGDMNFVADILTRMSIEFNIAVDSPHHVRKGTIEPGDADSGRGSSGIRDAARLVYTLVQMSKKEAEGFNVSDEQRRYYIRLDPAKINIAAPPAKAIWYKLESIAIGNGNAIYQSGDRIQVAVPWQPPTLFDGLDIPVINKILDEIAAGFKTDDGLDRRYSSAPAAKDRAVFAVIQKYAPDKTEAQCRQIINRWLDSKLLVAQQYRDPVDRKQASGLYVDEAKRPGTET